MKQYLPPIDEAKMQVLFDIETAFKEGRLTAEEAQQQIAEKVGKVSPYHLAYIEQTMTEEVEDECVREDIHRVLHMLGNNMDTTRPNLPEDHPLNHYIRENDEMRKLLLAVEDLVQYPVIKNQWLELYDQIGQYPIHYHRKQNQLYPVLEKKGFMRPSTTMWTFDDLVRDHIRNAQRLLDEGKEEEFIALQPQLVAYARDLMEKEEFILFPTSLALISDEEFEDMKSGDREIGFAFFTPEEKAPTNTSATTATAQPDGSFAQELQALLAKHGYGMGGNQVLDVATGKLTLEQINLIYKHLPIDISYVDENELVCFYSDTDHRIFPRSKNVIGREVMNCHPKKSAHVVREVIDKLRSGEQDKAEFWINKPGVFIYILYVAVRDAEGRFRGVLEMMQECSHIRELEGSRTLLTWENEQHGNETSAPTNAEHKSAENEQPEEETTTESQNLTDITAETRLKDLLKQCPKLKKKLPRINPAFKMLNSPLGKLIVSKATVGMMSERSDMPLDKLIAGIKELMVE